MDSIKATLKKIAVLAERGVGGERDNAQRKLELLLKKHGLSIHDVLETEAKIMRWFAFYHASERTIIRQCLHKVLQARSLSLYKKRGSVKCIGIEMTDSEYKEAEDMITFCKKQYRQEKAKMEESFVLAFIEKHKLYSGVPGEDDDDECSLTEEEVERLRAMYQNLSGPAYIPRRRRLDAFA